MQTLRQQLSKPSSLSIGIVVFFAAVMTFVIIRSFAAIGPATLYTSPGGVKSVYKGNTFTTNVRISTASNVPVTGASVYMTYPSGKLSVKNVSYNGSPYNFKLTQNNSGGVLRMDRASLPAISGGDKFFAKVTFKAKSTGSASVGFKSESFVTSGEDDSDLSLSRNGVVYKISSSSNSTSSSSSSSRSQPSSSSSSSTTTSPMRSGSSPRQTSPSDDSPVSIKKNKNKPGSGGGKSQSPEPFENTGTLEILVVDSNQQPIEGSGVTINGKTAKTDKNGIVIFSRLPVGENEFVVDYAGTKKFGSAEVKSTSTVANPQSLTVEIDKNKTNPLIWIMLLFITLLGASVFVFGRPWLGRLRNRFRRKSNLQGNSNNEEDSQLPISPNASPPGSTVSPDNPDGEDDDATITPEGFSDKDDNNK